MAIYRYTAGEDNHPITTTSSSSTDASNHPILYTSLAFAALGLPLLTVTALTVLLSFTLLLISSPLLILSSPLLLLAGFVLAGFGFAGAAGCIGVWSLRRPLRVLGWSGEGSTEFVGGGRVRETVTESRQRVREEEEDLGGGCSHRRVVVYPPEDVVENK